MDGVGFDDNVIRPAADNSNAAVARFLCLPKIKRLFRIIEILLILVFLASASTRLPFVFKISGEYCRRLVSVLVRPLFIFLLGNVIVLALVFKSRHLFSQISDVETHLDLCEEFITHSCDFTHFAGGTSLQPGEIVFQDKQIILEAKDLEEDSCTNKPLQRSETAEKRRTGMEDGGEAAEMVEELSNEEFQRAIEAFIEKEIKFRQQEKLAIAYRAPRPRLKITYGQPAVQST